MNTLYEIFQNFKNKQTEDYSLSDDTLYKDTKTPWSNYNIPKIYTEYKMIGEYFDEKTFKKIDDYIKNQWYAYSNIIENMDNYLQKLPFEKKNISINQNLSLISSFAINNNECHVYNKREFKNVLDKIGDELINQYVLHKNMLSPLVVYVMRQDDAIDEYHLEKFKILPRYEYIFSDENFIKLQKYIVKEIKKDTVIDLNMMSFLNEYIGKDDKEQFNEFLKKEIDTSLESWVEKFENFFKDEVYLEIAKKLCEQDIISVLNMLSDEKFVQEKLEGKYVKDLNMLSFSNKKITEFILKKFKENISKEEYLNVTQEFLRDTVKKMNKDFLEILHDIMPLKEYNWNTFIDEKPLFFNINNKDLFIDLINKGCHFDYQVKINNKHYLNYLISIKSVENAPLINYVSKEKLINIKIDDSFIDSLLKLNKVEFLKSLQHNKENIKDIFHYQRDNKYFSEFLVSVDNYARLDEVFELERKHLEPEIISKLRNKHIKKIIYSKAYANSKHTALENFAIKLFNEMNDEEKIKCIQNLSVSYIYNENTLYNYEKLNLLIKNMINSSKTEIEDILTDYINNELEFFKKFSEKTKFSIKKITNFISLDNELAEVIYKNSIKIKIYDLFNHKNKINEILTINEKQIMTEILDEYSILSVEKKKKLFLNVYEYNQKNEIKISVEDLMKRYENYKEIYHDLINEFNNLYGLVTLQPNHYYLSMDKKQKLAEKPYIDLSLDFLSKNEINCIQEILQFSKEPMNCWIKKIDENTEKFFIGIEQSFIFKNLNQEENLVKRIIKKI